MVDEPVGKKPRVDSDEDAILAVVGDASRYKGFDAPFFLAKTLLDLGETYGDYVVHLVGPKQKMGRSNVDFTFTGNVDLADSKVKAKTPSCCCKQCRPRLSTFDEGSSEKCKSYPFRFGSSPRELVSFKYQRWCTTGFSHCLLFEIALDVARNICFEIASKKVNRLLVTDHPGLGSCDEEFTNCRKGLGDIPLHGPSAFEFVVTE